MSAVLPRLLPVLALGLTATVLAACGTQTAPGSPGASAGVSTSVPSLDEPVTSSTDQPATVPTDGPTIALPPDGVLPSDAGFEKRARQVAAEWGSRGLVTAWRQGLIPLAPLTTAPGFGADGSLKLSYLYGWVRADGTLPTPTKPGGQVQVGGTSIPVTLLGAKAALAQATPDQQGDCPPVEGATAGCGDWVTVTGATLTTTTLATNRGVATVPAWAFTIRGNAEPLVQVAVSPGDLTAAPAADGIPGTDGTTAKGVVAASELISVDGSTVTYTVGVGACDTDITPRVLETDDLVLVGATVGEPSAQTCIDLLKLQPVQVTTTEPIGDRPVVDALTGAALVPRSR